MSIKAKWIQQHDRLSLATVFRAWPMWLAVLLGVLLAWLVIRLVWLLIIGPTSGMQTAQVGPQSPAMRSTASAQSLDAVAWALFGEGEATEEVIERLPIDRSTLSLVGVVQPTSTRSSDRSSSGYAMIRGSTGQDQLYRQGDALPDGRTVSRIEMDRVVVSDRGRQEVLVLSGRETSREADPISSGPTASFEDLSSLPAGIGIASLGGLRPQDIGSLATGYGDVQWQPVSTGGYRLRPAPDAHWFSAVGLQVNDVLTAINGQPVERSLQSAEELERLALGVMDGERVSITVERNGQVVTLQPSLESVRGAMNKQMRSQ